MNTTALIFARLGELSASLAIYNAAPAVFSDRAPDDFIFAAGAKPAAIIAAPASDDGDDTFTSQRRQVRQDIRIYAYDSGSVAQIDALGRAVRALFHNQESALSDLAQAPVILCNVSGPVDAPTTDAAVIGRRLTLNMLLGDAS